MSTVNNTNPLSAGQVGQGPNLSLGNVQLMYAQLQLSMSDAHKMQAMNLMKDIENNQARCKELNEALKSLRRDLELVKDNKGNHPDNKVWTKPAPETLQTLDRAGVKHKNNDLHYSAPELEALILQVESEVERLGSSNQQSMVLLQDHMGQYNSYLQGASSSVQNANQTTSTIVRNN